MSTATMTKDPLDQRYFTTAAHTLDDHLCGPDHQCMACKGTWPCAKALAAAFMLELQATELIAA